MRLIGILAWYDERPPWLAGVVAGLAKAEVAHLIAVDGAYALYPDARGSSNPEQAATIRETCRALDMGCTIHAPQDPWFGNEVEKRTTAFRLAETVAEPFEDWYFLADADHFVTSAIGHLRLLKETGYDVAEVAFSEPYGSRPSVCPLRCVFRALPGLYYDGNHHTLRDELGRNLLAPDLPGVDLARVQVEHRTGSRDPARKEHQELYYRRRDEFGAERVMVAA